MENPFNSCIAAKLLKVLRKITVSVAFYSKFANEHERNLNKRRRQLQSLVLGVLVFLWRNFLHFWFFSVSSWQLILANFARYCTSFQDRGKKCKKSVGVFSRQAKRSKIFAKEARESCIKVINDHSSFSCNLHQICYLQPFLMNQFFFRKTHFFSNTVQIWRSFEKCY